MFVLLETKIVLIIIIYHKTVLLEMHAFCESDFAIYFFFSNREHAVVFLTRL